MFYPPPPYREQPARPAWELRRDGDSEDPRQRRNGAYENLGSSSEPRPQGPRQPWDVLEPYKEHSPIWGSVQPSPRPALGRQSARSEGQRHEGGGPRAIPTGG
jgi:hypothetical protein